MKTLKLTLMLLSILFIFSMGSAFQSEPYQVYKARGDRFRYNWSDLQAVKAGMPPSEYVSAKEEEAFFAKAVTQYKLAINERQDLAECYYWIAHLYKATYFFDTALMYVNDAVKYVDKFPYPSQKTDALYLKAELDFLLGHPNEAVDILKQLSNEYYDKVNEINEGLSNAVLYGEEQELIRNNLLEYGEIFYLLGLYFYNEEVNRQSIDTQEYKLLLNESYIIGYKQEEVALLLGYPESALSNQNEIKQNIAKFIAYYFK